MKTTDYIHINEAAANQVAEALAALLADFQVFYPNLRGFHWNIKGHAFFTLHAKFEELYNDAAEKVDEIAERILTKSLGKTRAVVHDLLFELFGFPQIVAVKKSDPFSARFF